MKRTTDTTPTPPNRRALIQHQHTLLRDPQVAAFLDGKLPDPLPYNELSDKLIRANEPALLLALLQHTQSKRLLLCATDDTGTDVVPLPDGLLAFFAQRINEAPSVTNLVVVEAFCDQPGQPRLDPAKISITLDSARVGENGVRIAGQLHNLSSQRVSAVRLRVTALLCEADSCTEAGHKQVDVLMQIPPGKSYPFSSVAPISNLPENADLSWRVEPVEVTVY